MSQEYDREFQTENGNAAAGTSHSILSVSFRTQAKRYYAQPLAAIATLHPEALQQPPARHSFTFGIDIGIGIDIEIDIGIDNTFKKNNADATSNYGKHFDNLERRLLDFKQNVLAPLDQSSTLLRLFLA